jgi:hypothetical protein
MPEPTSMLNKTSGFAVFFSPTGILSRRNEHAHGRGLIAALDYISGGKFYTLVYLSAAAAENGKNLISMRNRANYCCY